MFAYRLQAHDYPARVANFKTDEEAFEEASAMTDDGSASVEKLHGDTFVGWNPQSQAWGV
jgi:hypothetical protein